MSNKTAMQEQEPCKYCGKSIREQLRGCNEITCYRQHLKDKEQTPEEAAKEWKLIGHSHQIADTGDYDGCYEITNGKVSIFTQDDDDEALQPVVNALNDSGCKFYLDDMHEVENYLLREQIKELKAWQAKQSNQLGMKWVKGSERLPENCGVSNSVIIRGLNHGTRFTCYASRTYNKETPQLYFELGNKSFVTVDREANYNSTFPIESIEWLDEPPKK